MSHSWISAVELTLYLSGFIIIKWIKANPDVIDANATLRHKNAREMMLCGSLATHILRITHFSSRFPLAYFLTVFPVSVIRQLYFYRTTRKPSPGWLIFGSSLLTISGLLNFLLWLFTGRRFGIGRVTEDPEIRLQPLEQAL